jgi:drug/metabolite transporter superfamily protein YnfA
MEEITAFFLNLFSQLGSLIRQLLPYTFFGGVFLVGSFFAQWAINWLDKNSKDQVWKWAGYVGVATVFGLAVVSLIEQTFCGQDLP